MHQNAKMCDYTSSVHWKITQFKYMYNILVHTSVYDKHSKQHTYTYKPEAYKTQQSCKLHTTNYKLKVKEYFDVKNNYEIKICAKQS